MQTSRGTIGPPPGSKHRPHDRSLIFPVSRSDDPVEVTKAVLQHMPAVKCKLKQSNPRKHADLLARLEEKLEL